MKKILVSFIAIFAVVFGSVAIASPASATDGTLNGTATCAKDGTWTGLLTWNSTNVPDGVEGEIKAISANSGTLVATPGDGVVKGGQVFLSVWTEHLGNFPANDQPPVRTGNWSDQFSVKGIPNTVASIDVMVQYDYDNGHSGDVVTTIPNPGDCTTPPPVVNKKAWLKLVPYCNTVAVEGRHNVASIVHKTPNDRKHVYVATAVPNAKFDNGKTTKTYVKREKRGNQCGPSSS